MTPHSESHGNAAAPEAQRTPGTLLVAGVMSGTSADGVDVAFCRIGPGAEVGAPPTIEVLGHRSFAYEPEVRAAVLAAMDTGVTTTAALAQLHWRLGTVYSDAVAQTARSLALAPELVACHGQTIFHAASAGDSAGDSVRATWQIGEASVLAESLRVPVISDFRTADLAAGGQGAPLVPMLDWCLFRAAAVHRVLLNLGGIANLTVLPAGCGLEEVIAFDSGPANMVIDGLMAALRGRAFDCGGATAARGTVLEALLASLLRNPYFVLPPPKSCGREEFGRAFVAEMQAQLGPNPRVADAVATATALTVHSIAEAYRRFCAPHFHAREEGRAIELLASGGGAHNRTLMRSLSDALAADGVIVRTTADEGVALQAKEAVAFALLGWLRWHGLPGNVPSATGARRAVPLGKVTLP